MKSKSLARELALLVLGQVSDSQNKTEAATFISVENLLQKALDSLLQHLRERLDICANKLEASQQILYEDELKDCKSDSLIQSRKILNQALSQAEQVLNNLSASLEMPRLLILSNQEDIKTGALERALCVIDQRETIDTRLDQVMEGWRLKRLPRIDRDILRLAVVDLMILNTPVSVACNEAVELANRYSDEQGRRMINGVLRRLQEASFASLNK